MIWLSSKNKYLAHFANLIGYFILVVLFFGAAGIWIPFCIEYLQKSKSIATNLNQNIITYAIAIYTSSTLDMLLNSIEVTSIWKKARFLYIIIFNLILCILSGILIFRNLQGAAGDVFNWSFSLFIITCVIWFFSKYKDPVVTPIEDILGDLNTPLRNG